MTEQMHENTASEDIAPPSEDFAELAPMCRAYAYWNFGSKDHEWWETLREYPKVSTQSTKHASNIGPVIQPTLKSGVDALVVAALTFLTRVDEREGAVS